ncbi:hypothetical protein EsH8_VII_000586 [Colletotrichum jinshuiense]
MSQLPLGRYAEIHQYVNLNGPGDSRPTALQIVQDEGLVGQLEDKVALVTGVSSGLGFETLKALAATGATVYGTARDLSKARRTLGEDLASSPNVRLIEMDLASLDSVRAAAEDIRRQTDKLNILVNNAGVLHIREGLKTDDGFEMQFGVNHLAHFLLFLELKDVIAGSSTPEFNSRVVTVTSSGHRLQGVNWGDVNFLRPGTYDGYKAYGQSKTANILMANGVDHRFDGIHGYSVHPGTAMTGLQVEVKEHMEEFKKDKAAWKTAKSPAQCAATIVLAALSKDFEGEGPLYLEDCEAKGETKENLGWAGEGYAPWAWDRAEEDRLWELSLELVGLKQ